MLKKSGNKIELSQTLDNNEKNLELANKIINKINKVNKINELKDDNKDNSINDDNTSKKELLEFESDSECNDYIIGKKFKEFKETNKFQSIK